jgi:hypothetical protein
MKRPLFAQTETKGRGSQRAIDAWRTCLFAALEKKLGK